MKGKTEQSAVLIMCPLPTVWLLSSPCLPRSAIAFWRHSRSLCGEGVSKMPAGVKQNRTKKSYRSHRLCLQNEGAALL